MTLALIASLALLPLESSYGSSGTDLKPFSAHVIKVIDGDTIDIKDSDGKINRVRIYGVNTPERWEPCFKNASQFTSQLVLGEKVRVLPRGRGKYGRLLGFVLTDNYKSLGLELVEAGMARVYSNQYAPKNTDTYKRYQVAQIHAMNGTLGIWGRHCKSE